MEPLGNPRYIVVHESDSNSSNIDAATIREWHLARGWEDIGYHYVIRDGDGDPMADGKLEQGRDTSLCGAHCMGLNLESIGICVVGSFRDRRPSSRQILSLDALCLNICRRFNIPPSNIIGHCEVNSLVKSGRLSSRYRTHKTCPGTITDELYKTRIVVRAALAVDAAVDLHSVY